MNNVIEKYHCRDISSKKITKDKWFIGSALQSVNYTDLSSGYYYYNQPTIWTRMLSVDPVNPYWEVHNETENFLLIDRSNAEIVYFLQSVLATYVQEKLGECIKLYSFGKGSLGFLDANIQEIELEVPFHINKQRVGNYRKIFALVGDRFYPAIDCTEFQINKRGYFEININLSYLEMLCDQLDCIFCGKRYLEIVDSFGIGSEQLISDQRVIRLISLVETVKFIEKYQITVASNYLGHTVKKIYKLLAIQMFLLKIDIDMLKKCLKGATVEAIDKELVKLQKIDTDLLKKYDPFTLYDRYGITKEIQDALNNSREYVRHYSKKTIKYFTDIPFCGDITGEKDFIETVYKIQAGK